MKSLAQKPARSAAKVQRKPSAPGRQRDGHEVQADQAARAFVRGETGLGSRLTPTPAAGFVLPGSRGESLPLSMRTTLEAAYDAHLGAVRIHRDAAAEGAASKFGAHAFASGSHIFFGAGRFDLASECGRELIAHEVAHVLQQTGRATSDEKLAATPVAGHADVQCAPDDDPTANEKVSWLADGKTALKALIARHQKHPQGDERLAKLIVLVKNESNEKLPVGAPSAIGTRLIQIAIDGQWLDPQAQNDADKEQVLTLPATGFLVDCLKVCGEEAHFKAAARLIDGDAKFEIRSAFGPRTAFRQYLDKNRGEDWIVAAFGHPSLKTLWAQTFLNTFEQYVLNPGRPRQSLYTYKETREKELKNVDGAKEELLAGDRLVMAVERLGDYDKERLQLLEDFDARLAKANLKEGRPQERMVAAILLAEELAARLGSARSKTWAAMLERMWKVADAAGKFWRAVGELREANKLAFGLTREIDPDVKRVFAKDDPVFKPLHDLLKSAGVPGGLYFLDKPGAHADVPKPAEYETRIVRLGDKLGIKGNPEGNVLLTLQSLLLQRYQTDAGVLDTDAAKAIGLAIWWLLDFKPVLLAYKAKDDNDALKGFTDRRLRHRVDVASEIAQFSQVTGWADTLADAFRVRTGEDVNKSYLIVKGNWEINDEAPINQLQTEMPEVDITVGSGSMTATGHELALFFHIDIQRQLREAVDDAVKAARKGGKLDAELVNQRARDIPRPWRCTPVEPMLVLNPAEFDPKGAVKPPSARKLINESNKSMAELGELARQKKLGPHWVAYAPKKENDLRLFAWLMPSLGELIDHLRGINAFQVLMKKAGQDGLVGFDWFKKLIEIYRQENSNAGGSTKAMDDALAEGEQAKLDAALRAFTTLNRRQVRQGIVKQLLGLAKDRHAWSPYFTAPQKTVKAIDEFAASVQPTTDSSTQMALLVLSLGDELDQAFDSVGHSTNVPALFHKTLIQAVEFADNELKSAVAGTGKEMEQALTRLLHVNPEKAGEDEQLTDFSIHRDQIERVAQRIEEGMRAIQESMGFTSDDGETLKSLSFYPRIKPGRKYAFEMGGDDWELVKVHRKFTYHPALSTAAATSKSSEPILKDGNGIKTPVGHELIAQFLINGDEFDVYADDKEKMEKLSESVFYESLHRSMENLAEGIETGMKLLVDVVELVPGVGQEVMAARVAAQTTAFVASELPMIADAVKKDPVAFIEKVGKDLATKYLNLDGLITFVVLGQGFSGSGDQEPFESIRKPADSATTKAKTPISGKLGRVINLLRRLGMRLADALRWLQLRVAGPIRSLQSSIVTRPKLGWLLRKAIDIGLWARDIIPPDLADRTKGKQERTLGILEDLLPAEQELPAGKAPSEQETSARGLIDAIKGEVVASGEEFKGQFESRLELLREAELPNEIVPLELIVGIIIDFFLMRLGAKVRIAKRLLENTPPYQKLKGAVESAVAVEARGTKVDPNKYWRDFILDKIDVQFVDARNGLVDAVYGLSDRVADETGIPEFKLARPAEKNKSNFGLKRTDFPHDEIELAQIQGAVPDIAGLGELPATPGQPLAARVRVAEERRFGHDFGHVRLHTGGDAADALDTLNASGLTSGSHIFLRPGLDPERGMGAGVLRHELTHVLQQAGERPLGGRHDEQPLPGRRGVGLRIDDLREAAAEAMARADHAVAREPVDAGGGAEGIQPNLEGVAINLLQMFTEFHKVAEYEKAAGSGKVPGLELAVAVWIVIKKRISDHDPAKDFEPFAQPVAKQIAEHVLAINLSEDLPKAAALAQKPAKGARGKKPKTELDFDRFITLWEAVIFGRTGISMQLKAETGPPVKATGIKVGYVHLGLINPGTPGKSPLWDEAMKQTPEILGGEPDAAVRLELWQRLNALGPDPFVWKTSTKKFQFSSEFVEAFGKVRSSRKPELVKQLPGKDPPLPQKSEYLNPAGETGIGLRIGLHGGVANLPKQKGVDRESHHTTQYLLVQFFRNDNTVKAWQKGVDYSGNNPTYGVQPAAGEGRKRFVAPKGALELEQLDPGGPGKRGAKMPAILISADLHRRGQLHVEKASKWNGQEGDPDSDDSQGRVTTQGFSIQAEFKRQLGNHVGAFDTSPNWNQKIKEKGPNAAADSIYDSMVGTYHWMHGKMMQSLKHGLTTRELAYYRAIASHKTGAVADAKTGMLTPQFDLTANQMETVYNRALSNNNAVMQSSGWPPP